MPTVAPLHRQSAVRVRFGELFSTLNLWSRIGIVDWLENYCGLAPFRELANDENSDLTSEIAIYTAQRSAQVLSMPINLLVQAVGF